MLPKTPETPQFNKPEKISSKMFGIAEKVGAQRPDLHQTFSRVGNEFATENYDKGQRILEKQGVWNDEVRGAATEANQAGREKVGAKPISFDDAKVAISGYAKNLAESGTLEDRKGAALIESIAAGMNRPGQTGIDGIDEALKYIEGALQTKSGLEQQMNPQMKKDWEEQRAVRDALFIEKQKRMEKMRQTQKASEGQTSDQSRTNQTLESLYAAAGVPNETPSRQQSLQRVSLMSPEEIHFLNVELGDIAKKFKETGDPKDLDAALFDLTTKKFTKEEVYKKTQAREQSRIEEIRRSLDLQYPLNVQEPPEERHKKYKNYEAHKDSAERAVKALQEIKNTFENSNDISGALMSLEGAITNVTLKAEYENIIQLRGKPIDLDNEKAMFNIDDDRIDDYKRMREAQNALSQGKSVKEVASGLEGQLSEAYGVKQVDLNNVQTVRELSALKIDVDLFPEMTDKPELNGKIKEMVGIGYHISDVPQYNAKGELIGKFNKSVKAKPKVIFYKSR